VTAVLLAVWLLPVARASTLTEIPPFLKGDFGIGYGYDRLAGTLSERAQDPDDPNAGQLVGFDVGHRRVDVNILTYRLAAGVAPGVALTLDIPQYISESTSYTTAQSMVYNPASGTGTSIGTPPADPGVYQRGAGVGGLWIAVRGLPFSETYEGRNNQASWKVSLGVRTPDHTSFWQADETGRRGGGPGGLAWRFGSSFSKTLGNAEPYLDASVTLEGPTDVTPRDNRGEPLGDSTIVVTPADHGELRVGTEVLASRNHSSGAQLKLDAHLSANYASWAQVPSGVYLPDVLASSEGTAVQHAEFLEAGGGVALRWRPMEFLEFDLWGDLLYHMPQRIEAPYAVYTWNDTLRTNAGLELVVRLREGPGGGPPPEPVPATDPWGVPPS
jgi:hypothetical protein